MWVLLNCVLRVCNVYLLSLGILFIYNQEHGSVCRDVRWRVNRGWLSCSLPRWYHIECIKHGQLIDFFCCWFFLLLQIYCVSIHVVWSSYYVIIWAHTFFSSVRRITTTILTTDSWILVFTYYLIQNLKCMFDLYCYTMYMCSTVETESSQFQF